MSDTDIVNLCEEKLVTELLLNLQTNVSDNTKVTLVREGKLQDDPTVNYFTLLTHPGGEEFPDVLNDPGDNSYAAPVREIGGSIRNFYYRRRFKIEYSLFFNGENNRKVAHDKAQIIKGRAERTVAQLTMPGADSFGERAYDIQWVKSWIREDGGPGEFIWRGYMWVEFLTSYQPG
jgi:hypothetical protein